MRRYSIVLSLAVLAGTGCAQYGATQSPLVADGSRAPQGWSAEGRVGAVSFTKLHTFDGPPDGARPFAPLTSFNGTLYGTTSDGGAHRAGTVFTVTPTGVEAVVHSFTGGADGANPEGGLFALGGRLYGTTRGGGAKGLGTVYSVDANGTVKNVYSFKGGADDGAEPRGELTGLGTELWGTTTRGGPNDHGTVFSLFTLGHEEVIYSFRGKPDGAAPVAGVALRDSTLYGTTTRGGISGLGCVFAIALGGIEHVVYSFQGGTDGAMPESQLVLRDGTLYGTTREGGAKQAGTVFEISKDFKYKVLANFDPENGSVPTAGLTLMNKKLYGTTLEGGPARAGSIYELQGSTIRTLHVLTFNDGRGPRAPLAAVNGVLYGTAYLSGAGGGSRGHGTAFALKP